MASIEASMPGASFEWHEDDHVLTCSFGEEAGGVAKVNHLLLPLLLAQTDVLGVAAGTSLEEAYLSGA